MAVQPNSTPALDPITQPLRHHLYHVKEANAAHARVGQHDHRTLMAVYAELQSRSEDDSAYLTEETDAGMRLIFADLASLCYHRAQVRRVASAAQEP